MIDDSAWRLIEDGALDGRLNMAIDRAILTACERGQSPATLRLYGWEKPTLSIGYSQNEFKDVDKVQCEQNNIPIVRRFTGGRALLHQFELTYSLVAPIPHTQFPGNLAGAFGIVSKAVIASLKQAGVPQLEMVGKGQRGSGQTRSPACFSAINHWEITAGGKKLVGSAQRRLNGAFLQHGSILLDWDPELAHSLLRFSSKTEKIRGLTSMISGTQTLKEILPVKPEWEQIARCFAYGFQNTFPGFWKPDTLNASEVEFVKKYLKGNEQILHAKSFK
ncbi:MAG TPA: lipoate--protein ligase family protein [Nitrospinaceae bacterium]|nr:lipoate--protein ligase family protein [Nitrospinaceae bacterium]